MSAAPTPVARRRLAWGLLAVTPALPWLGLLPGGAWLAPLAAPLTVFSPAFASAVRQRRYPAAWAWGLAWAALWSAGVLLFASWAPQAATEGVALGERYRVEMFRWIETGVGREGNWREFIPQHLVHFAGVAVLALASGGYLGLAAGALLLGYMNYYVACFAAASDGGALAIAAAWAPWAVLRVLAFLAGGVVLARPLLVRGGWRFARLERRWLWAAACGLAADALLKATLAPRWGLLLRGLLAS